MPTSTFVKLAREVIKFIRNGNKLRALAFNYDYRTKTACALGAVVYNNREDPKTRSEYQFIKNYLGLGFEFFGGFDDSVIGMKSLNTSEEYNFGYAFGKMCKKRNWIF